jgi:acyl CoA:acetate/3-ketoacid CoA transferase alpha subunit/acyl CoA:acetate/3-ketoacid CoA transferase beta subunit
MNDWRAVVANQLDTLHSPRIDKRMPLADAIRRLIKPGMTLNPVSLQARPVAALHELIRQFHGRDPRFTFVSSSLSGNYLQLVGAGLLEKAVISFAGEGYPTPGPSPVVARALDTNSCHFEHWTMLTLSLRLLAGAQGVPFAPTRSLIGSDMASELRAQGVYEEIDDPFSPGTRQAVIRALRPDVSFVHCWAADPAGNAICFPPHQENVYGALAAKQGVVLTAHHIVDAEFIRRHSHLVRIPADRVAAVCHVPYGSHPYGNYASGIPEFTPYANDYAHMREHRQVQESAESYERWLREWILDLDDHDAYLGAVGRERFAELERDAAPESWRQELDAHGAAMDAVGPASPIEEMIVQAARVTAQRVREGGFETLLSGVGQAALAAWLATHSLRDEGIDITLLAETGMVGHDPRPSDPFLINYRNMPTTTQLTDVIEALGIHACGAANHCLATLGAAQVDRFGNVNSTRTKSGRFLVGSGGANDVANAAAETLLVARQLPRGFVEKVDFVTSPGDRVGGLVSTHGRYERRDGQLVLTGVFQSAGESPQQVVEEIRTLCGWKLEVAPEVNWISPATPEELALLRVFDPERFFLGRATGDRP